MDYFRFTNSERIEAVGVYQVMYERTFVDDRVDIDTAKGKVCGSRVSFDIARHDEQQ